jgi:hypothetical protein
MSKSGCTVGCGAPCACAVSESQRLQVNLSCSHCYSHYLYHHTNEFLMYNSKEG